MIVSEVWGKRALQISWHLQTLASASLFTSRLSRNVTAVFPFFFSSLLPLSLFLRRITKRLLLFTDIQHHVYMRLPPCWRQCKQRARATPTLHKNTCREWDKHVDRMSGGWGVGGLGVCSDRRHSSLSTFFIRSSESCGEVSQELQLLVSSKRGC